MRLPHPAIPGLVLLSLQFGSCSGSNNAPTVIIEPRVVRGGLPPKDGRAALDQDFAQRGFLQVSFDQENVRGLAVDAFDRVLVAGRWEDKPEVLAARIQRYEADGSRDLRFGRSGRFFDPYPNPIRGGFWQRDIAALTLDSLGRILAVGQYGLSPVRADLIAWRLRQDGAIPSSAPGPGPNFLRHPHDPKPEGPFVVDSTLDSEGRLVILSHTVPTDGSQPLVQVTRCEKDGGIDQSFGDQGSYRSPATAPLQASALCCDDQNRILIAGRFDQAGRARMAVWRLDSAGALDKSFGAQGFSLQNGGSSSEAAWAQGIDLDSHGRILITGCQSELPIEAGGPRTVPIGLLSALLLLRLDPDGIRDGSFGQGGIVHKSMATGFADWAFLGRQVRIDSLERIWVVATCAAPQFDDDAGTKRHDHWHMCVLRFTNSGKLDPSFNEVGYGLFDAETLRDQIFLPTPRELSHRARIDSKDRLVILSGSRLGTVLWRLK